MSNKKTLKTFTKEEIEAAKSVRDGLIKGGFETEIQAVFMAGEICMWAELTAQLSNHVTDAECEALAKEAYPEHYSHQLAFIKGYNHATPAKEEWVSVDDRMPERNEPLMGYNDDNELVALIENNHATVLAYNPNMGIYKAKYDKGGWSEISSISNRSAPYIIPTHWQPLPPPPQPIKTVSNE